MFQTGRDQFYIEDMMRRANISIPLGKFPTRDSVSKAVHDMAQNIDFYASNVKKVYHKLRIGSEEKLEKFIDSLIEKRHSTRFDVKQSNVWSYAQALTLIFGIIISILATMIAIIVSCIFCTLKLVAFLFNSEKNKLKSL